MGREWKRYQVSVHCYGRRLITRDGPCQGLLEWPAHTWGTISTRPMGLKAAIALADAQSQHAVVTLWMSADKVHDNGKAPAVPAGWYAPDAQVAAIRGRSPLRLSAEIEGLIQQAAQAHGTPDDVTGWAQRLARDVRDLSD